MIKKVNKITTTTEGVKTIKPTGSWTSMWASRVNR